jgi:hypothetical protein
MTHPPHDQIDLYIDALRRALERRGLSDGSLVDEVREHLVDAAERGRTAGLGAGEAEQLAIERVGSPQAVVAAVAADRARLDAWLLAAALAVGAAIAYVDSRPTWDDTGVTAGTLLLSAAALSYFARRSAWLIAMAVGIWIPTLALIRRPAWPSLFMFLVPLVPLTGALIGQGLRRLTTRSA